jgi:hypothetical protein
VGLGDLWRRSRYVRWAGTTVIAFGVSTVVSGIVGALWLRTNSGNQWLAGQVESLVTNIMYEGRLEIGGLRTDLWSYLEVTDLQLLTDDDKSVLAIDEAFMDLKPAALLSRRVKADVVRVHGIDVDLDRDENGMMELQLMFAGPDPSDEPWAGLPVALDLARVEIVGGSFAFDDVLAIDGLVGGLRIDGEGSRLVLADIDASTLLHIPARVPILAQGEAVYTGDAVDITGLAVFLPGLHGGVSGQVVLGDPISLDIEANLAEVSLAWLYPFTRRHDLAGWYSGDVDVSGPLSGLAIDAELSGRPTTQGSVKVDVTADVASADLTWNGDVTLTGFHVDDAYPGLTQPVVLQGTAALSGQGVSWPDDLSVDGTWTADGPQSVFAQDLDDMTGSFGVKQGKLTLAESAVSGVIGDLGATGEIDLVNGPMNVVVTGALDMARLQALGLTELDGVGSVDAVVTGDVMDLDKPIVAEGSVIMAPFEWGADIRFQRVRAHYRAEAVGTNVSGKARAVASDGTTFGATIAEVVGSDIVFHRDDLTSGASGTAVATAIDYEGLVHIDDATASFDGTLPAEGAQSGHVIVVPGSFRVHDFAGAGGTAVAQLAGDDVAFAVDLLSGARQMLGTTGNFNIATQELAADSLAIAPTARVTWRSTHPVLMRLENGGIADAQVRIQSPLGTLSFDGTVAQEGPVDVHLLVRAFSLDAIAELFPVEAGGLSGMLDLELVADGDARAPRIDATLKGERVWVPDVSRWLDLDGTIQGPSGALMADLDVGVAGELLAHLKGTLPVILDPSALGPNPSADVDLTLSLTPGPLKRLAWLSPDLPDLPDGRISAQIDVKGPLRDPDITVAGVTEVDVHGWSEPGRTEFYLTRSGETLDAWTDVREGLASRAQISGIGTTRMGEVIAWALGEGPEVDLGDYEMWADNLAASAVLLGIPARSLAAVVDLPLALSGDLVGGVSLSGSPYRPEVEGGVHWLDAQVGAQTLDGAYASVVPGPQGYLLDTSLTFPEEGGLVASGVMPIDVDLRTEPGEWTHGQLAVHVDGQGVPLALASAVDPGIKDAAGLLTITGDIGGTLTEPHPDLVMSMNDASLRYRPLGMSYDHINLAGEMHGQHLELKELSVNSHPDGRAPASDRPSRMKISGKASLDGTDIVGVKAQVALQDAWLAATPDTTLRVDGGLVLSGGWPYLRVAGDPKIKVVQGRLVLDSASFLNASPLDLDPVMRIHRAELVEAAEGDEEAPPFYQHVVAAVDVELGRNVQVEVIMPFVEDLGALGAAVTSANLSARIGSDEALSVRLKDGLPEVTGEVEVIEGAVEVWLGKFALSEGTVSFIGADVMNPTLKVHGDMRVQGGEIAVDVGGTPEAPNLVFSSSEWPEQSQIMMILLTGSSPDELSANQGRGTAVAFAGLLLNSVFQGVRLGSLNIEPDGTVQVGVPISNTVFGESTVSPTANLPDDNFNVRFEWSAAKRLIIVGGAGNVKASGDVLWELRF